MEEDTIWFCEECGVEFEQVEVTMPEDGDAPCCPYCGETLQEGECS